MLAAYMASGNIEQDSRCILQEQAPPTAGLLSTIVTGPFKFCDYSSKQPKLLLFVSAEQTDGQIVVVIIALIYLLYMQFSQYIRTNDKICFRLAVRSNLDSLIARSPSDEFMFSVPRDPMLSPYWADDAVLRRFPPLRILVNIFDKICKIYSYIQLQQVKTA